MSILGAFRKGCYSLIDVSRRLGIWKGEMKEIRKRKSQYERVVLSEEEKSEIEDYFVKNYGKRYSDKWHRLYQSYTGTYRKDYFPEILFSTKVEPQTNPFHISKVFDDKNMVPIIVAAAGNSVRSPEVIFARVNGSYTSNGRVIGTREAEACLKVHDSIVVKKAVDTSSGRDVLFSAGGGAVASLDEQFGLDYIVQAPVVQSCQLSTLYPDSVNTFRVVTYLAAGNVFVAPVTLRLGRGGAKVDNIHHGGIFIGVHEDGGLMDCAFAQSGECFTHHPDTHVRFEGYKIEHIKELVDAAIKLHQLIPWLKVLSWDLTLDQDNRPLLIELNATGQAVWFPQYATGDSMFGENTPYFLRLASRRRG